MKIGLIANSYDYVSNFYVLFVASSYMFASAEYEQTLEDATALPKKESASETGDSNPNPNYSLSDHSSSDISDNKSSSFDEVNVSALNEKRNIDLTKEKENRKLKSRKRKRAVP